MSRRVGVVAAVAVGILLSGSVAGAVSAGSTHFPRYKELEPNVAFWRDSFTKWTSKQIVFHDVEHLDLVYSVLSVDDLVTALPLKQQEDAIRARRKAEGERLEAMLERIGAGQSRTEEEHRIVRAIARIGHEPEYASTLAAQIRSQRGLGDKFCGAMERAYAYLPMMRQIMRSQQVPEELVALPLVESGYQIGADSSVGAAGIWQFMPATGRLYLDVNDAYDDRRDPLRATEAAARMLRKSYDTLGSWPLAITSYNHGLGGVANAVKTMGTTHFGVIARHYKGKTFGFASRNFYAEFLAASDSVTRAEEICGPIRVEPYRPDEFTLEASASLRDLAKAAGISVDELETINPALRDSVVRGTRRVPAGYRLNLPSGSEDRFALAYAKTGRSGNVVVAQASAARATASASERSIASAASGPRRHKVARGQTLSQIASHYGTSVATLQKMNSMGRSKMVRIGQVLEVPGAAGSAPAQPMVVASSTALKAAVKAAAEVDTGAAGAGSGGKPSAAVQAAEAAADAAKTAVAAVPAAAVVASTEPTAKAEPDAVLTTTHKVGRGQTLTQIASMYKTSVDELKALNGISDSRELRYGQSIKVRTSGTAIAASAPVGAGYKVRTGDTLWSIAQAQGTSVETLKRMNPSLAGSGLKAGTSVRVPARGSAVVAAAAAANTKATFASHRVQPGQSLSGIAQKYGTSVDEIKRVNGIRDSRKVQAGQTLRVPL
ncbi:MAG: LysM peptidoglycan-binding domain-containing protein [Deltaproteobacteria bacterium]|nr:LysM peptidoglycan-binding domain-containing protein [Deltaproteobacteria bacterium]